MKSKLWLVGWLIVVVGFLGIFGLAVYHVDPYFHYHKPYTEGYFYSLYNERSQNDGITKHFDYDAIVTGTSMIENFKTSEVNSLFGVNAVKVPYSGASYKEINDNLKVALTNNDNLRLIIRGIDASYFFSGAYDMRYDLGTYPTYLYDDNPFNDTEYLFARDIIFGRVFPMIIDNNDADCKPGITSFDDYMAWQYPCGMNEICPTEIIYSGVGKRTYLSDYEKEVIRENIVLNVTSLAEQYPEVDFYYFFTPYSYVWALDEVISGYIYKYIEAEKYIIELILEHENIHLYSFNNRTDIRTDLNNYRDDIHYAYWVNSLMLKWMRDPKYLITRENYEEYLDEELDGYLNFDYNNLNGQEDYENDLYAAALLNNELTGAEPINLLDEDGKFEKVEINNIDDYRYLVFTGCKSLDDGILECVVINDDGIDIASKYVEYGETDSELHQYIIDITKLEGDVTIEFRQYANDEAIYDESFVYDLSYNFKEMKIY